MKQEKANLFRIKEGKLDQWLAWCNEVNTSRRDEAIATIQEEAVWCEFFVTFKVDGAYYTLGAEIGNISTDKQQPTEKEINRLHRQNKQECLEYVGPGNFSYLLVPSTSEL